MMVQIYKYAKSPKQAALKAAPIDKLLDANFFKALGDPTRLKLLACMAKCGRGCSVSEVAECCSVDFSVVSRHLAILARAGIIESSKVGRVVTYCVRHRMIAKALSDLADAISGYCDTGANDACCKSC